MVLGRIGAYWILSNHLMYLGILRVGFVGFVGSVGSAGFAGFVGYLFGF